MARSDLLFWPYVPKLAGPIRQRIYGLTTYGHSRYYMHPVAHAIRGLARGIRPCCIWHYLKCRGMNVKGGCVVLKGHQGEFHPCLRHARGYEVLYCEERDYYVDLVYGGEPC